MSKAVTGGILLGVAGGLLAAATGGLGAAVEGAIANSFFAAHLGGTLIALGASGVAQEAAAIGEALASNRGSNLVIRQPAAFRQIILGTQRVGGVIIDISSAGAKHDHVHRVIVLAGHVCHSILNIYLDGRKVYWDTTREGHTVRNGVAFGGWCDANDHIGPDGNKYNFKGNLVYCEARYGDQLPGDVMASLTANDPTWAATADGSPYVGGCTYVYLQWSTDATMFPQEPEVRFDVNGKCDIYDPRTQSTGFTTNWALLVADRMTDPVFGLGMDRSEINMDQLVIAANVCDEAVALAKGGAEARYSCNWHGDSSQATGNLLNDMMTAAGGRLSKIGGEWSIWPSYWQGPSFNIDKSMLLEMPEWEPFRSLNERFNRVTGTYVAPNYPYNPAGNVYSANGYAYDGSGTQNNFQFGFQPTNYPQYAMDVNHGYPSDAPLAEDRGHPLPKEISMPCTLSIAQAQRVAKIYLKRHLYQGSGTLKCSLAAWGVQPTDVVQVTFPEFLGWQNKLLEVTDVTLHIEEHGSEAQGSAMTCWLELKVQETGPDIYDWNPALEELSPYNVQASLQQAPYIVASPTNLQLASFTSTGSNAGIGGNSTNYAIQVSFNQPLDGAVTQIEMQAKRHSDPAWYDAGIVSVMSTSAFVYGVDKGTSYDVRIRSVRSNGAASDWVEQDSYTV